MNLFRDFCFNIFMLFHSILAFSEQSREEFEKLNGSSKDISGEIMVLTDMESINFLQGDNEKSNEISEEPDVLLLGDDEKSNELLKGDMKATEKISQSKKKKSKPLTKHANIKMKAVNKNDAREVQSKVSHIMRRLIFGWPMGVVPYYVDRNGYDVIIMKRIRSTMDEIEDSSCVVFQEMTRPPTLLNPIDWLHITNPNHERECVHQTDVGKSGEAVMVLGYDCMERQDILHALLHALGFKDEITHPQRDQYITILWNNIQPKYRPLFRINTEVTPYKKVVEYDSMSVMHFHDRAYSIDGGATIAPLVSGLIISPSEKLSQLDVMKLRLAFGHECNKRKVGKLLETCKMAMADNSPPSDLKPSYTTSEAEDTEEVVGKGGDCNSTSSKGTTSNLNSDYDP